MRLLLLTAALAAAPVAAQDAVTLTPGHPDLTLPDGPPETRTVEARMIEPQAQSLGTITESMTLDGDVLTIVSRANIPMAGAADALDSTRVAWPSLVPLSHNVVAGEAVGTVTYADGQVSGTYDGGRGALPFEFDLESPVFAPSTIGLLLEGLPFEPGYSVVVPTFSAEDRFKEARLTVTGQEGVEHDGETVAAWAVEQRGGGGLTGNFTVTHYVDVDTGEHLYSEFRPQPTMLIQLVPLTPEEAAAREAEQSAAEAAAEAARAAASDLRPGAEALAADALGSYTAEAVVRLVAPMEQDAGTDTRTVTVDEAAGTVTIRQVIDIPMAGQRQETTIVSAYPSLAPISMTATDGGDTTELSFADGRVTGTHEGEPVDATLDGPVFASGIVFEVVRLLPFAEGYSATYHGYSSDDGVVETLLTVTGQEEVGGRTAWVVTGEREGNPSFTFHVDAETRELLSYGFSPQPGVRIVVSE